MASFLTWRCDYVELLRKNSHQNDIDLYKTSILYILYPRVGSKSIICLTVS